MVGDRRHIGHLLLYLNGNGGRLYALGSGGKA